MVSTLCSLWDNFSLWVTNDWNETTFMLVMSMLGIIGLLSFLGFFKGSYNKGKKPKWGSLIISLAFFALVAVLSAARFA